MASNSQNHGFKQMDGTPEEEFLVTASETAMLSAAFGCKSDEG